MRELLGKVLRTATLHSTLRSVGSPLGARLSISDSTFKFAVPSDVIKHARNSKGTSFVFGLSVSKLRIAVLPASTGA